MPTETTYKNKKITIGRKEYMISELKDTERDIYFCGYDDGWEESSKRGEKALIVLLSIPVILFIIGLLVKYFVYHESIN